MGGVKRRAQRGRRPLSSKNRSQTLKTPVVNSYDAMSRSFGAHGAGLLWERVLALLKGVGGGALLAHRLGGLQGRGVSVEKGV